MVPEFTPNLVAEVLDVTITYGKQLAVASVSLSLGKGEFLAIIGPDGAGKSSLLRAMAGLQPVNAGTVHVLGMDAWEQRRFLHEKLGYLPQIFALYGDLTVDENLAFLGHLKGLEGWRRRRETLLDHVGLRPFRSRRAAALSGGMKQKLALAAALMHDPDLLILDEPTTGVDPISRREFQQLLSDLAAQGLAVVMATPYLDEAQRAHHIILMHQGQILAQGQPSSLVHELPGKLFRVEGEPLPLLESFLASRPGVEYLQPFGKGLHLLLAPQRTLPGPEEFAAAGIHLSGVHEISATVEDVFLYKLRHSLSGGES